jgi:hypothetical protein
MSRRFLMKEFYADKIQSEDGAETVEIIIGIVVFVIFGLTVFGMVTNTAGKKTANIANCVEKVGEDFAYMDENWNGNYGTSGRCTQDVGEVPPNASYN